jgi:hypothetical protein
MALDLPAGALAPASPIKSPLFRVEVLIDKYF